MNSIFKKLSLIVVFLISYASLQAQSAEWADIVSNNNSLLVNVEGRNSFSLDGKWDAIVDQQEIGFYNYRYKESDDGWFINRQVQEPSDLIEYNFNEARKLNVPDDWNTQAADLLRYEGTIWYRKVFNYDKQQDKRYYLYFGAVNYEANVYLNGEKIGSHEGGFTPFNFEVTDKLKNGENFVVVKVDNKRKREALPTVIFDWWNYGGITRSVHLIEAPQTFIHNYSIQLDPDNNNQIKGWVKLNGPKSQQNIKMQIPELSIDKSLQTNSAGYAEFSVPVKNITYWNPEIPKQYAVDWNAETDAITEPVGFRSIETDGYDILLNGESIFLRGICMHEESPFGGGRSTNADEASVLFGWAHDMNCNFLRLAHYPHNEHTIRTANEMGILLWSEIPVYWTILWKNQQTIANARQQLREMINRDKNKASVILWSVANETPLEEGRLEFISNLVDYAKALDPSRLLTAALENHMTDEGTKMIDDPLGAKLDVIGNNNYCGWYSGEPQSCAELRWETIYKKPLILSEFGGGALQGYYGEPNQRWTEDYQAEVYRYNIEMLREIPFLRGTTPWLLMDFRSPRRPLANIQDDYNRKGLVSERGKKKKAFFMMKDFYEEIEKEYETK
ncbi:glycoside hydrolase family 2 TIM barrel-domain containing protein [uncultured Draconibacterium sp.]|uniref:glycoside hydrolase family 2 protein n=1 Tax=uncultured Draconibacterium sp. TaxID=1573823 RepID=UPI0029C63BCE|nr:glycoside hydrolase family 2 TIM barrel-domain containing protein [uncultured Draconibacterium sp.]